MYSVPIELPPLSDHKCQWSADYRAGIAKSLRQTILGVVFARMDFDRLAGQVLESGNQVDQDTLRPFAPFKCREVTQS